MRCPTCHGDIKAIPKVKAPIMACDRCDGIWLSKESIKIITNKYESAYIEVIDRFLNPDQGLGISELSCPSCITEYLVFHRMGQFKYVQCHKCGGVQLNHDDTNLILEHQYEIPTEEKAAKGILFFLGPPQVMFFFLFYWFVHACKRLIIKVYNTIRHR